VLCLRGRGAALSPADEVSVPLRPLDGVGSEALRELATDNDASAEDIEDDNADGERLVDVEAADDLVTGKGADEEELATALEETMLWLLMLVTSAVGRDACGDGLAVVGRTRNGRTPLTPPLPLDDEVSLSSLPLLLPVPGLLLDPDPMMIGESPSSPFKADHVKEELSELSGSMLLSRNDSWLRVTD